MIVDYKTDRFSGEVGRLARGYQTQLDAYRGALEAAGVKVKEAALRFSQTGELFTR